MLFDPLWHAWVTLMRRQFMPKSGIQWLQLRFSESWKALLLPNKSRNDLYCSCKLFVTLYFYADLSFFVQLFFFRQLRQQITLHKQYPLCVIADDFSKIFRAEISDFSSLKLMSIPLVTL